CGSSLLPGLLGLSLRLLSCRLLIGLHLLTGTGLLLHLLLNGLCSRFSLLSRVCLLRLLQLGLGLSLSLLRLARLSFCFRLRLGCGFHCTPLFFIGLCLLFGFQSGDTGRFSSLYRFPCHGGDCLVVLLATLIVIGLAQELLRSLQGVSRILLRMCTLGDPHGIPRFLQAEGNVLVDAVHGILDRLDLGGI